MKCFFLLLRCCERSSSSFLVGSSPPPRICRESLSKAVAWKGLPASLLPHVEQALDLTKAPLAGRHCRESLSKVVDVLLLQDVTLHLHEGFRLFTPFHGLVLVIWHSNSHELLVGLW